ncbi:unnamed protein product [Anisakis simplex]|uniref:N-acetyltransferase domain-containing protein n=1 Tax=Anisakis simplex TaxID=6269 RepID=A0A0M3K4D2_ANISI|nr:unnamed protein product [Anisakis simplex]
MITIVVRSGSAEITRSCNRVMLLIVKIETNTCIQASAMKTQKLEPFNEVLQRQVPRELGKPIPMKAYNIAHPKNCGDPWIGAYSKHGFWYKFVAGNLNDYEKIVAISFEADGYCMNYESFESWKSAFGEDSFTFIVAKNLKEDVIGSIGFAIYEGTVVIGIYYVVEDYRHSGIGNQLFKEALKRCSSHKNILFHSYKPSGIESLKDSDISVKQLDQLTSTEQSDLLMYDRGICSENRSQWFRNWLQHIDSNTILAFDGQGKITGFGNLRELSGGFVRRLLVGPLYADNAKIAAAILFHLLAKFYHPENDSDWDPDVFAVYRRSVHFIMPECKTDMLGIMQKLSGDKGSIRKQRLRYKVLDCVIDRMDYNPYAHLLNCSSIVSGHLDSKLFGEESCDPNDAYYLPIRYDYEIIRCDDISRRISARNHFERCVKKILPRQDLVEDNHDPYEMFFNQAISNTTTIKKVVEITQAKAMYPQRLFKVAANSSMDFQYIVKKVIVERKVCPETTIAADPWDVFFHALYKPEKPHRYDDRSLIDIENVVDNVRLQIDCKAFAEYNYNNAAQLCDVSPLDDNNIRQQISTGDNQKMRVPSENVDYKEKMRLRQGTDKETRSVKIMQIDDDSGAFSKTKLVPRYQKKRVMLRVDRKGTRFLHYQTSGDESCKECELVRDQFRGEIRRSRGDKKLMSADSEEVAAALNALQNDSALPKQFYLPHISTNQSVQTVQQIEKFLMKLG